MANAFSFKNSSPMKSPHIGARRVLGLSGNQIDGRTSLEMKPKYKNFNHKKSSMQSLLVNKSAAFDELETNLKQR